jgi:hypothetical protein
VRVCKETEEAYTLKLAHIFILAEVFSYRSDQEDLQKGTIHLLRRFCIWLGQFYWKISLYFPTQ